MPYRMRILVLTLFLILLTGTLPSTVAANHQLVVAWVDDGNLWLWREGDSTPQTLAKGDVTRPYLASDGQQVAFTRGGIPPTSLWLVGADGQDERQLTRSADMDGLSLAQIAWEGSDIVYFNTVRSDSLGFQPQNDLWRVNITTGAVESLRPFDQGGSFSISPNGQSAIVVYPGAYNELTGRIRLLNLNTLEQTDLLSFYGVSTGAQYAFYPEVFPEVFWQDDFSAIRVAIPDPNLIYDDVNSPPTVLWQLSTEGESEHLGSVSASLFGQPRWSDDASQLTYLRRMGDITSNQFELMIADGSGQNATTYANGEAGELGSAHWLPGVNQFVYIRDQPGHFWLGEMGKPPRRLAFLASNLQFVDSTTYVYATAPSSPFELRVATLSDPTGNLIASVQNGTPIFHALLARTSPR